ncbi:hypothetical protein Moror_11836, partial [Moniliophthora roreri MCA 2997]
LAPIAEPYTGNSSYAAKSHKPVLEEALEESGKHYRSCADMQGDWGTVWSTETMEDLR